VVMILILLKFRIYNSMDVFVDLSNDMCLNRLIYFCHLGAKKQWNNVMIMDSC